MSLMTRNMIWKNLLIGSFALDLAAGATLGLFSTKPKLTSQGTEDALSPARSTDRISPAAGAKLIEPGRRVGPLKLGDTRERALELFTRKLDIDQEYEYPNCGTSYEWVDLGRSHPGNVFIEFKKGLVSQIGSATIRFHTAEGITSYSSPGDVQRYYKALRAYLFLGPSPEALGGRSLILWSDSERGIAFVLAFDRKRQERDVYEIIVFKPKSSFCFDGYTVDSSNFRELAPYSLEP